MNFGVMALDTQLQSSVIRLPPFLLPRIKIFAAAPDSGQGFRLVPRACKQAFLHKRLAAINKTSGDQELSRSKIDTPGNRRPMPLAGCVAERSLRGRPLRERKRD
jgi:hypothetical protein